MSNWLIPGNIKLQYVPFVLNPENPIHGDDDEKGYPQHFTFKDKYSWSSDQTKYGVLGILPGSFKKRMADDLSNKLLYSSWRYSLITYLDVFNSLPMVLIREYLPDSKMDQVINFFADFLKGFKDVILTVKKMFSPTTDSGSSTDGKTTKDVSSVVNKNEGGQSIIKKILCTLWYVVEYLLGIGDHGTLVGNMFTDSKGGSVGRERYQEIYKTSSDKSNKEVKVTDFPYAFYYAMQSCTTTGIYEIPGIVDGKVMYSSNGSPGWEGGTKDTGFSFGEKQKNWVMKLLTSNISISWSPFWDPIKGVGTPDEGVVIKFNLFNDNAEVAMQNFIFVNTLIPNNRWILYGIFSHSGAVYDVKLEGYRRLFFCTGQFSVGMNGVLRDPPYSWLEDLCMNHANKKIDKYSLLYTLYSSKAIKIPDIYEVTMTFTSQLPQNFNTWLFNYSHNFDNFARYSGGDTLHDGSFVAKAIPHSIDMMIQSTTNYWKSGAKYEELTLSLLGKKLFD